jgi:fatty acid desaturase
MLTAIKRLLQYSQTDRKNYDVAPWKKLSPAFLIQAGRVLWPVAITQSLVLAYYTLTIGPQFYFLIYVLPIFTLYPAQIRLRTAVEHAFEAGYVPQGPEAVWVARSVNASWLERLIIAPLDIPYHFEHHLLPGVPYYNLSKVRKLLEAKGFPVPTAPGYLGFMRAKSRSEQGLAPA